MPRAPPAFTKIPLVQAASTDAPATPTMASGLDAMMRDVVGQIGH
jgi:hypothetical protein